MVTHTGKKLFLFLGDISVFFFSLFLALSLRHQEIIDFSYFSIHIPSFGVIAVCFLLSLYIIGLYDVESIRVWSKTFVYIVYSAMSAFFAGITMFYIFPSNLNPKLVLVIQVALLVVLLFLWRIIFERYKASTYRTKAILIGEGPEYQELKRTINEEKHYPIYFVDHVVIDARSFLKEEDLHSFHSLLKKNGVQIIVADIRDENISALLPYLYNAASEGILLYDMRRLYQDIFKRMPLNDIGYFWFFENVSFDTKVYEAIKRVLDFFIAIILCVPWLIVHPFVSFLIKREDGGSFFIKQERLGRHGKIIYLYKYRTMTFSDTGKWLPENGNNNKVTKIGHFLRKSRIDELPQALALLKGDISFIGPRPDVIDLGRKLSREVPYYMIRYSVRPGLSGWAVVNQEKPPQTLDDTILRLQYDLYYVKHRSLLLDVIILLRTVKILLSRNGM